MKTYQFLNLKELNEPYLKQLTKAAERVIRSGRYIGGQEVADFEQRLADRLSARHVIAVGNGLDALRLILMGYIELGLLNPGDEVIVPANSFVASALAVTQAGLTVKFADVDYFTYNLQWESIHFTERTRAIMPVHLYGRICPIPEKYKQKYLIIEDCAQAVGASIDGHCAGTLGHAAGISFYPTKNLGALGDAGAIVTDNDDLADAVTMLRNYGTDRPYHNVYAGINSRMDPLQAAFLNIKLDGLDAENAARRANAEAYDHYIDSIMVALPLSPEPSETVWHQYVVKMLGGGRQQFREFLSARGVETAVHYPVPIHKQPCYAATHSDLILPATQILADTVVSLPINSTLTPKDIAEISKIINAANILSF